MPKRKGDDGEKGNMLNKKQTDDGGSKCMEKEKKKHKKNVTKVRHD